MIKVRFDGSGSLADHDDASVGAHEVPSGGVFETTKKRLKELLEQDIPVSEVKSSPASPAAVSGDDNHPEAKA